MYVISYKRNYISVSIIYTQTKHTHWEENRGRDFVNLLYQCHVWMGLLLDRSLKLGLALEVGVLRSPPQISTHSGMQFCSEEEVQPALSRLLLP